MSQGNGFDDETPTEGIALSHPANREVLAFIARDIEVKDANGDELQSTYEAIRAIRFPVGPRLFNQLLVDFQRKNRLSKENLETIRSIVGGR